MQWGANAPEKDGPLKKDDLDMHAGQSETSNIMISHPDLVHLDRAARNPAPTRSTIRFPKRSTPESGGMRAFPNHYSGDGSLASSELGEVAMKALD